MVERRLMGNRRARDLIKKLEKKGFEIVGQRGSHIKMRMGVIAVIIPYHGGKDLGLGLIRKIEKQAGIKLLTIGGNLGDKI